MNETITAITPFTRYDAEINGVHWSRFQPQGNGQALTFLLIPGTAHIKGHMENAEWLATLTSEGHSVITYSPDRRHRLLVRLRDMVDDLFLVMRAAGLRPERTIPVGHSLGGGVALEAARREQFAGLVVLASLAPSEWPRATVQGLPSHFLHYPLACLGAAINPAAFFRNNKELACKLLFRPETPEDIVATCLSQICDEAPLALFRLLLGGKTLPLATKDVLFMSGAADGSVPTQAVERSAQLYQQLGCKVQFERLLTAPHDLMLDGARPAATLIREFALALAAAPSTPVGEERSQG